MRGGLEDTYKEDSLFRKRCNFQQCPCKFDIICENLWETNRGKDWIGFLPFKSMILIPTEKIISLEF